MSFRRNQRLGPASEALGSAAYSATGLLGRKKALRLMWKTGTSNRNEVLLLCQLEVLSLSLYDVSGQSESPYVASGAL